MCRARGTWRRATTVAGALAVLGAAAAEAQAPAGAGPRRTWSLSLDGGSQYESNVRFGTQDDQGDLYRRISGAVSGGVVAPRGGFELDARGDVIRYDELHDLDRITYDFGLRATRVFSERFRTVVGARTLTSVAGNGTDASELPFLPLAVVRTHSGTASTSWRLTPTLENTNDVSYTRISFDAPGYVGGSTANGRVQLTRRLSPATSIGLSADGNQTTLGEQVFLTTGVAADWARSAGTFRLRLRAGGAVLTSDDTTATSHLVPSGEAEVRRDGLRSSVSLRYARGVMQTFGLGQALTTDQVNLSFDRRWRSGVTWRSSADQSWSVDPSGVMQQLETSSATTELRVPMVGGTWFGVGAFLRKRVFGDAVNNHGVYVSAGLLRRG